ncbi:hypothetical protein ANAPH2_01365 [Anaplasma phagocytophilum]|nr:hypothetical protein ANAPH2_01365 [Anaplasma phagocytophilum]
MSAFSTDSSKWARSNTLFPLFSIQLVFYSSVTVTYAENNSRRQRWRFDASSLRNAIGSKSMSRPYVVTVYESMMRLPQFRNEYASDCI